MVNLTRVLFAKTRKYMKEGFRDSLRVQVRAGTGGNGYPKFGGVGGQGGSVIAIAREGVTLDDVRKTNASKNFLAKHGRHSSHNFILGIPGENLTIDVPVGVTVYTELGKKIGELNQDGEELILAKGGNGGHPKNGFLGTKGQSYPIRFDLKLIADIGLVGFPNAGKSTLLKAISHAKPKIANYPFTTIRPNVGMIIYKDLRKISMADLPGLIEGAHINKGMGHNFLKHVERTKLLLLVVDINGFQLSPEYPHRNCIETIFLLNKELELYNEDLLKKPAMLVINKMDIEGAVSKYDEVKHQLKNLSEVASSYPLEMQPSKIIKFDEIMAISAKESVKDIEFLKNRLRNLLDIFAAMEESEDLEQSAELYNSLRKTVKEKGPRLV